MIRVLLALVCAGTLFIFTQVNARAASEICPAQLRMEPGSAPASLYAFEIAAFGPRSVTATLAFDTSAGWFKADVPTVKLASKDRHYFGDFRNFTFRDWISPMMYVRFPTAVTINHRYVSNAHATDDGQFGWDRYADFACPPPAPTMERAGGFKIIGHTVSQTPGSAGRTITEPVIDPKDRDNFNSAPGADSVQLAATPIAPLQTQNCDVPFQDASLRQMTVVAYPDDLRGTRAFGLAGLFLVLHGDGSFADAWVWEPSGKQSFDQAAIADVEQSTYTQAIAYCKPVPAIYLYQTLFDS